jgi:transcriptional regulator HilA, main transcriptional regulator of SPI1
MAGADRICLTGAKERGLREMEASISPGMVAFEGFRFDVDLRRLLRPDATGVWAPAAVGARALDVLAVLLRQPGALVTKDVIMQQVWPDTAVEANNLTVQITALRKVLDGGRASESCIQTVAGRGYRFVAYITRPLTKVRISPAMCQVV